MTATSILMHTKMKGRSYDSVRPSRPHHGPRDYRVSVRSRAVRHARELLCDSIVERNKEDL